MKRLRISDWLIAKIVGRPWTTLLIGVLVLGALAPGLAFLGADFSYRIWFDEDDPYLAAFDAFERRFGNDEAIGIVVQSPSGVFDHDTAALLVELTEQMWKVSEVVRVESLANFSWVHVDAAEPDEILIDPILPDDEELTTDLLEERRHAALTHEKLPGYLVSKDGTSALVLGWLQPGVERPPNYRAVVHEIEQMVEQIRARDEARGSDHRLHITGLPAMTVAFERANQDDFGRILPVVVGLCCILLFVMFRSVAAVGLTLLVSGCAIVGALAVGGYLGIRLNNISFVVPEFLLAIALADSVHILASYARAAGDNRRERVRAALAKNLVPTVLTSVTTAAGFWSFAGAKVAPIADLGVLSGVGTVFAWLFTYLVLGPILTLAPLKLRVARGQRASRAARGWARWVSRHRPWVLAGSAIVVAGGAALAANIQVDSDPYAYLAKDHPLNVATDALEDSFGHAMGIEISVNSGRPEGIKDPEFLRTVDGFQTWIASRPGVGATSSFVDIVKAMNRALHGGRPEEYRVPDSAAEVAEQKLLYSLSLPAGQSLNDRVSIKNDQLRLSVQWAFRRSERTLQEIAQVEQEAKRRGLDVEITGKTQLYQRLNPYVVDTFLVSLGLAVLVVGGLLALWFRSLRIGALAMIPNGVPLVLGAGVLAALGRNLDAGTAVVFATCLGIAVDDTVHFLASFVAATRRGEDPRNAVQTVLAETGPALVITTGILSAAFVTFAMSVFVPNIYFGVMIAIILLLALAADLVILPALVVGMRRQPVDVSEGAAPAPADEPLEHVFEGRPAT
jgi:uncharacterized protein